jgi:hypothetical protein
MNFISFGAMCGPEKGHLLALKRAVFVPNGMAEGSGKEPGMVSAAAKVLGCWGEETMGRRIGWGYHGQSV